MIFIINTLRMIKEIEINIKRNINTNNFKLIIIN